MKMESSDMSETAAQTTDSSDHPQQNQQQQHQQYLGDVTQGLPEFEELDTKDTPLQDGITEDDLDTFADMYREHCEAFLDVVVNLQFTLVEALWQSFWRHTPSEDKSDSGESDSKQYVICRSQLCVVVAINRNLHVIAIGHRLCNFPFLFLYIFLLIALISRTQHFSSRLYILTILQVFFGW